MTRNKNDGNAVHNHFDSLVGARLRIWGP